MLCPCLKLGFRRYWIIVENSRFVFYVGTTTKKYYKKTQTWTSWFLIYANPWQCDYQLIVFFAYVHVTGSRSTTSSQIGREQWETLSFVRISFLFVARRSSCSLLLQKQHIFASSRVSKQLLSSMQDVEFSCAYNYILYSDWPEKSSLW